MTVRNNVAMLFTLSLGGCGSIMPQHGDGGDAPAQMWIQSALVAAGPHASATATLTWIMFGGAAFILLLVVAFTALAIAGGHSRNWMSNGAFVFGFGIAFPIAVLTALLIYGFVVSRQTLAHDPAGLRIEVVGEQWWWRVYYVGPEGKRQFETANEIRIPTDVAVEFVLEDQRRHPFLLGAQPCWKARHDPRTCQPVSVLRPRDPGSIGASARSIAARSMH